MAASLGFLHAEIPNNISSRLIPSGNPPTETNSILSSYTLIRVLALKE